MNYYFFCFVIAIIFATIYFAKWNNNYSTYLTLSFVSTIVTNLGYWQLSYCESVEEALIANRVIYTGASFNSLLIMLSIFELCKIDVKKVVRLCCFGLSLLVYISSLSVGYTDLFYKSVTMDKINAVTVIHKQYGPMHTVYYFMIVAYFLFGVTALIYALKRKRDVSVKNAIFLLICNFMSLLAFALGRVLGTLDAVPMCIDVVLFFYLIISDRFILYDVDNTAIKTMMNHGSVGVAAFDLNRKFLGCNDAAKAYYPVLNKLRVDFEIDKTNDFDDIINWMDILEKNHEIKVDYDMSDHSYNVMGQFLMDGNKVRGIQFIIRDCTEEKRYQEHLEDMTVTDDMTGILNRRAFERDLIEAQRNSDLLQLHIISFDLNGLKSANDNYGHFAGDEMICATASLLTESFSKFGTVYRIGGDEFEAILFGDDEELEKACRDFDIKCASWRGKYVEVISVSKGLAAFAQHPDFSLNELVKEADKLMYIDKSDFYKKSTHDRRR